MDPAALAALRRSYELAGLDVADVDPDPVAQFLRWLGDAVAAELMEPNAMVLATADANGRPRARTLLLKVADSEGFSFFTNYGSTKGQHLAENPQASLCFPWLELERQVTVTGAVQKVSAEEISRLLPLASTRQPARRLDLAAERGDRLPRGAQRAVSRAERAVPGWR